MIILSSTWRFCLCMAKSLAPSLALDPEAIGAIGNIKNISEPARWPKDHRSDFSPDDRILLLIMSFVAFTMSA